MMETVIAVGVGVVVAGGILTLVWRILLGDREQRQLDAQLSNLGAQGSKDPHSSGRSQTTKGGAS